MPRTLDIEHYKRELYYDKVAKVIAEAVETEHPAYFSDLQLAEIVKDRGIPCSTYIVTCVRRERGFPNSWYRRRNRNQTEEE